jgi:hypothetical protein
MHIPVCYIIAWYFEEDCWRAPAAAGTVQRFAQTGEMQRKTTAASAPVLIHDDTPRLRQEGQNGTAIMPPAGLEAADPATHLARCFLRLANLPSYPLDRLSRYEATLWRQASQILLALDVLDRRNPQDRGRRLRVWQAARRNRLMIGTSKSRT